MTEQRTGYPKELLAVGMTVIDIDGYHQIHPEKWDLLTIIDFLERLAKAIIVARTAGHTAAVVDSVIEANTTAARSKYHPIPSGLPKPVKPG